MDRVGRSGQGIVGRIRHPKAPNRRRPVAMGGTGIRLRMYACVAGLSCQDAYFAGGFRCGDSLRTVEHAPRLTSSGEAKRLFQTIQIRSRHGEKANPPGTMNTKGTRGRECCECRSSTRSSTSGDSGEWRVWRRCVTTDAQSTVRHGRRSVEVRPGKYGHQVRYERMHSRGAPGQIRRPGAPREDAQSRCARANTAIWLLALLALLPPVSGLMADLAPGSPGSPGSCLLAHGHLSLGRVLATWRSRFWLSWLSWLLSPDSCPI